MARPKKNNAAYFSHDAGMRNDLKVKAIRNKFGNDGYAVWCMLLEVLTESENFECAFDELSKELLAADFNVTSSELTEIVYYCVILKLLVIDGDKLYSNNLKKRFKPLVDKRQRDRSRIAQYTPKPTEEPKLKPFESDLINVDLIYPYLLSDGQRYWFETFCMNNRINENKLKELIIEFTSWLIDGGIKEKNKKDLLEHFRNWFNKRNYVTKADRANNPDDRKQQLINEAREISQSC
jgi:hypothetical protein